MQIQSLESKIYLGETLASMFMKATDNLSVSSYFLLMDSNTEKFCYPLLSQIDVFKNINKIVVKPGEEYKTIKTTEKIWHFLSKNGADRHSLLFILGGGVLCDMGGFAAATFKRGIKFITMPTTLLAQVDASIGGKLGVDSDGLKNEIGLFKTPHAIIVNSFFLKTLEEVQLISGFAEMIKHALIYGGENLSKLRSFDILQPDFEKLEKLISKSIFIKNEFVHNDPKEKNIRKALNFGHTFGHAFETFLLRKKEPILHGYAVAHGMIAELILSSKIFAFPEELLHDYSLFILSKFGAIDISISDFEEIKDLMLHDKKNKEGKINFTLLRNAGEYEIDITPDEKDIKEVFESYIELLKEF